MKASFIKNMNSKFQARISLCFEVENFSCSFFKRKLINYSYVVSPSTPADSSWQLRTRDLLVGHRLKVAIEPGRLVNLTITSPRDAQNSKHIGTACAVEIQILNHVHDRFIHSTMQKSLLRIQKETAEVPRRIKPGEKKTGPTTSRQRIARKWHFEDRRTDFKQAFLEGTTSQSSLVCLQQKGNFRRRRQRLRRSRPFLS